MLNRLEYELRFPLDLFNPAVNIPDSFSEILNLLIRIFLTGSRNILSGITQAETEFLILYKVDNLDLTVRIVGRSINWIVYLFYKITSISYRSFYP